MAESRIVRNGAEALAEFATSGVLVCGLLVFLLAGGCTEDEPDEGFPTGLELEAVLTNPDVVVRTGQFVELLSGAPSHSAASLRDALFARKPQLDDVVVTLFATWWAQHDPDAAWRDRVGPRMRGGPLWIRSVARSWAIADPEAALQVARSFEGPADHRVTGLLAAIEGAMESPRAIDYDGLFRTTQLLPRDRSHYEALDIIVNRMVERDGIDSTIRFTEAMRDDLPGEDLKAQTFRRLATAITNRDPERALLWAARHTGGPYGKHLIRRIGARWGWIDGKAAMEWARDLPADLENRDRVVLSTYRGWMTFDREQAQTWMRSTEQTEGLAPALEAFITDLGRSDPTEALEWVPRLQSESRRERSLIAIGRRWLAADPEGAARWLEEAALPPAIVESISANTANSASPSRVKPRAEPAGP